MIQAIFEEGKHEHATLGEQELVKLFSKYEYNTFDQAELEFIL